MRQIKVTKSITNRDSEATERYLRDIGKYERISPEEEVRLTAIRKSGGPNAQKAVDKLTNANLRFVVSVAKKYQHQGLTLGELINEGNVGLIKAAWEFDETKGFKFISYAVWWIRQSIMLALASDSRIVRLPLNKVGLSGRVNKQRLQFEQIHEREPSVEELAEIMNMPEEEIAGILSISDYHKSLDAPTNEGEDLTLYDRIQNNSEKSPDSDVDLESLREEIRLSLSILKEKEKDVLTLYYGLGLESPLSVDEIANKFGYTTGWVRDVKKKALRRLSKNERRSNMLRKYLG